MSNSTAAGSLVMLQGTDFSDATDVWFGGTSAQFVVQSPTTILATVPSGVTASVNVTVTNGNGTSAVTPAAQVVVSSGMNGPSNSCSKYVIPSNEFIPYFTPGETFDGTTGPTTPNPGPPGVLWINPQTTEMMTFVDGVSSLIITKTDNGTKRLTSSSSWTNTDGSWETRTFTQIEQLSYYSVISSSADNNGGGASTSTHVILSQTLTYIFTDQLNAGSNTGFLKISSETMVDSYQGTSSANSSTFSSDLARFTAESDQEFGTTSTADNDIASNWRSESGRTFDSFSGVTTPDQITKGSFCDAGYGSDRFKNSDLSQTTAETFYRSITGSDRWGEGSTGTYTLFANGTRKVTDQYSASSLGNDNYDSYDDYTSTTTTPDFAGSTTLFHSCRSSDDGFDEYALGASGTINLNPDGTTTSTDIRVDNFDGNEEQKSSDSGWVQSNETMSDGTLVNARDDFSDSNDDKSKYRDGDQLVAGSVSGGTDNLSETSSDDDEFNTSDNVKITLTSTNSFGTPTITKITDLAGDKGTFKDGETVSDKETLGPGEVDLRDAIVFDNKSEEKDTATDLLKITISTHGQVGVGESLDSTETLSLSGTSPSSDIYDDPGTDDSTPSSDKESDNSTDTTKTADTIFIEDKLVSTDKTTLADGTVITDSVNNDDTDQITDQETDQTGDNHTDTSGAGGSNEKTSDDNTFDDEYTGSDNYSNNDNFSATIVAPVVGGTITINDGENLVINNGIAGETDSAVGEVNTANPAVDNETDTTDVTNTDQGTYKTTDSLSINITDPTTRVVTQITGGDTNTDQFSDDDGVDVTDTTPAGSSTDTETIQAHAKSGDSYVDESSLSISVKGSPSPGVTIDFLNNPATIDLGSDSNDDELPCETGGTGTESDEFSKTDAVTLTDNGHSNISDVAITNDGNWNSKVINESDNTTFGINTPNTITSTDVGAETTNTTGGTVVSDSETDKFTQVGEIDPYMNETTNANDTTITVDPLTGIQTTVQNKDNGSTDNIAERDISSLSDVHTSSLNNPGTDQDSGGATVVQNETTNTNASMGVGVIGILPGGVHINFQNTTILKQDFTDKSSIGETLTPDGITTDTESESGTLNLTEGYNLETQTYWTIDPTTGIKTTDTVVNLVENRGTSTEVFSDTIVLPSQGTASDDPRKGDWGSLKQAWSVQGVEWQTNSSGVSIGNVTTTGDKGTDTESESNGVITDLGVTDTPTSSVAPALGIAPAVAYVPQPGELLGNAQAISPDNSPQNGQTGTVVVPSAFNPKFIPCDRITGMIAKGFAHAFENPENSSQIAVTVPTPNGTIVLIKVPMVSLRSGYTPAHYEVAGFVPSSYGQFAAAQTVFIPQNVKNTAQKLMMLETALSLVPFGSAADKLSEGQYVDGLIDGAGDLAGTLVAFGKVLKVSAKTCQVLTLINQAVQVGTAAYNFNQGAQMLAEGGHSWLEISAKTGEGFLHLLGARVKVCFPAGTQVAIGQSTDSDGRIQYQTAAIETLRPGDFVLAREEYGPAVKPQRIEEAFEFTSNHLVMMTLADASGGTQTVTTTEDHPFWISERDAYLKPADILPGMTMVGPNEERQTVVAVERQVQSEWIPVYNFRVSEFHTYFVSQSSDKPPILVHNTGKKDCGEAAAAAAKAAGNAPKGLIEGFDFRKHLRGLVGDSPKGMIDPHAHHILFKKGHGTAQQALVDEGQAILRGVGIDPIYGKENLVWAPWRVSKQHGIDSLRKVVDELRALERAGGDYDDFVTKLKELGELAASRR